MLLAFLLPLTRLQAPFEINLLALDQIRLQRVRRLAPQDNAVPLGLLLLLAFLGGPVLRRRDAEAGDLLATRRHPHFRVLTEVADENHFIHATHTSRHLSLQWNYFGRQLVVGKRQL